MECISPGVRGVSAFSLFASEASAVSEGIGVWHVDLRGVEKWSCGSFLLHIPIFVHNGCICSTVHFDSARCRRCPLSSRRCCSVCYPPLVNLQAASRPSVGVCLSLYYSCICCTLQVSLCCALCRLRACCVVSCVCVCCRGCVSFCRPSPHSLPCPAPCVILCASQSLSLLLLCLILFVSCILTRAFLCPVLHQFPRVSVSISFLFLLSSSSSVPVPSLRCVLCPVCSCCCCITVSCVLRHCPVGLVFVSSILHVVWGRVHCRVSRWCVSSRLCLLRLCCVPLLWDASSCFCASIVMVLCVAFPGIVFMNTSLSLLVLVPSTGVLAMRSRIVFLAAVLHIFWYTA